MCVIDSNIPHYNVEYCRIVDFFLFIYITRPLQVCNNAKKSANFIALFTKNQPNIRLYNVFATVKSFVPWIRARPSLKITILS